MPRKSLRARIEERTQGRCEYCHAPQRVCGYRFHLEHIVPLALGGSDADANRALACASCNLAKSDRVSGNDPLTGEAVPLFHPRVHVWHEHFVWADDQRTVTGRTLIGRVTIHTSRHEQRITADSTATLVCSGLAAIVSAHCI